MSGYGRRTQGFAPALLLLLVLAIGSSCTMFDRDNRRLLNALDQRVQPESTGMRVALAPVFIPVGSVAVATDAVLIHPAHEIPRAAKDTYDLYWQPRDVDPFRKALLFAPIVLLTPPTFVGDLALRCLFPID